MKICRASLRIEDWVTALLSQIHFYIRDSEKCANRKKNFMSKRNRKNNTAEAAKRARTMAPAKKSRASKTPFLVAALLLLLCLGVGAFAQFRRSAAARAWLPAWTIGTGGATNTANAPNSSLAQPLPTALPALPGSVPNKEHVYAGGKLVAVNDGKWLKFDLAVWRMSTGVWYVLNPANGGIAASAQWGQGGAPGAADIPTPGDFDGDEKTDFAVFRPSNGTWYILRSSDATTLSYQLGMSGDAPVPADYDGDNRTDAAVFRSSNNTWYTLNSSNNVTNAVYFAASGDKAVPSDYDGDGKADIAVWRPADGNWIYLKSSADNQQTVVFQWGASTDKPLPGDYDGDGKTDYAVWQASGAWLIQKSTGGTRQTSFGLQGSDIAVPGDYDSDGKTDVAVWRPSNGTWYIEQSASSYALYSVPFGADGDIPVPAPYRRGP